MYGIRNMQMERKSTVFTTGTLHMPGALRSVDLDIYIYNFKES